MDSWDDFYEQFNPDPLDYQDILFGNNWDVDLHAQGLFMEWMGTGFKNEEMHEQLNDYMWERYGIDFDDVFEWQDFQEWYENQ